MRTVVEWFLSRPPVEICAVEGEHILLSVTADRQGHDHRVGDVARERSTVHVPQEHHVKVIHTVLFREWRPARRLVPCPCSFLSVYSLLHLHHTAFQGPILLLAQVASGPLCEPTQLLFVVLEVTARRSQELASEQRARLIPMPRVAGLVGSCVTHICIVRLMRRQRVHPRKRNPRPQLY